MKTNKVQSVHVIGAGFAGLTTAYYLKKSGFGVTIHEKSEHVGGLLQSKKFSWGLIESAANGLIATQNLENLAADIGVKLISAEESNKKRYIFRQKARQIPLQFVDLLYLIKGLIYRKPKRFENLNDYIQKRFGDTVAKYLIEPALQGVFSASLTQLSAELIYSYFFKLKTKRGSLRGTVAPLNGMSELIYGLQRWLVENHVQFIFNSKYSDLSNRDIFFVICTDATSAAQILSSVDEKSAELLNQVKYLPLTTATISYTEDYPLKGFGCLFPKSEGFNSSGVLFNSCIFKNRGPESTETWILPFIDSDDKIIEKINSDRERFYLKPPTIKNVLVTSWPKALPLYDVGLEKILSELRLPEGIFLNGNYLGAIGLSKILDRSIAIKNEIVRLKELEFER